ncbi:MAG: hypothetical protein AAGF24_01290 [Cyanobacteria bacterium P01_H01_bin.121]
MYQYAWNPALFTGSDRQQEEDGQFLIFWIDIDPPDPDDYTNPKQFERAWEQWAREHPELAAAIR